MKKRNITLCAVAMLCMQGYAKADTFILKGDNTVSYTHLRAHET